MTSENPNRQSRDINTPSESQRSQKSYKSLAKDGQFSMVKQMKTEHSMHSR